MLPIAQGNALGKRRPRLIHSAFLRLRKNATRRKRVTHYALNATRGVAPHKAGCSYRARHFNQCNIVPPGRCPGLSAAIGLTARHTCAANAVKSCIYMNEKKSCRADYVRGTILSCMDRIGDYSPFSILAFSSARASMSPRLVEAAWFWIAGASSFLGAFLAAALRSARASARAASSKVRL